MIDVLPNGDLQLVLAEAAAERMRTAATERVDKEAEDLERLRAYLLERRRREQQRKTSEEA